MIRDRKDVVYAAELQTVGSDDEAMWLRLDGTSESRDGAMESFASLARDYPTHARRVVRIETRIDVLVSSEFVA